MVSGSYRQKPSVLIRKDSMCRSQEAICDIWALLATPKIYPIPICSENHSTCQSQGAPGDTENLSDSVPTIIRRVNYRELPVTPGSYRRHRESLRLHSRSTFGHGELPVGSIRALSEKSRICPILPRLNFVELPAVPRKYQRNTVF